MTGPVTQGETLTTFSGGTANRNEQAGDEYYVNRLENKQLRQIAGINKSEHIDYTMKYRIVLLLIALPFSGCISDMSHDKSGPTYSLALQYEYSIIGLDRAAIEPNLNNVDVSSIGSVRDITVDAADNLYILDGAENAVLKISPEGRHLSTWLYASGDGPGELYMPRDIAISDSLISVSYTHLRAHET